MNQIANVSEMVFCHKEEGICVRNSERKMSDLFNAAFLRKSSMPFLMMYRKGSIEPLRGA